MWAIIGLWLMHCMPAFIGCYCCLSTIQCGDCTVDDPLAQNWRVVVTGISGGTDCSSINGTYDFDMTLAGGAGCCGYVDSGTVNGGFVSFNSPGTTGLTELEFHDNAPDLCTPGKNPACETFYSGTFSACSDTSLVLTQDSSSCSATCSGFPSTYTVNAV
jgi:hypothetical protein